jgi:hypothetical protein
MTCRHCGARIGILERWRYGDFCSREHKEEFARDNERLTEEILLDLRRPVAAAKPVSITKAGGSSPATESLPEPVAELEEPDPDMAGIVSQRETEPVRVKTVSAPADPPKTKPGWKEFASLANLDRAGAGSAKSAPPAHRQLWIEDPPAVDSGPYSRVLKRVLGLPHTQYRRRRPSLRLLDGLLSIDPPPEDPRPAITAEVALWGGWEADPAAGWEAGPESALELAPGTAEILQDYPITAPWDRWERWPVAAPAALPQRAQAPAPPVHPGTGSWPAPPSFSGAPVRPAGPAAAGPGGMLVAAAGPGPPRRGGSPRQAPPTPIQPAQPVYATGPGLFPAGPLFPTQAVTGMAGPGAGASYPAAGPDRSGGGPALSTPYAGAVWREMAPPMFLAQADLAVDLDPLDRLRPIRLIPAAFVHARPRVFRPRPQLAPPRPRVPAAPPRATLALCLADTWTPTPVEPVRWRP